MRSENQTRPSCLRGILILRPGIIASRLRARNAHTAMYARTRISISWLPTSMIERPCRPGFFFFCFLPLYLLLFFFFPPCFSPVLFRLFALEVKKLARARVSGFLFSGKRAVFPRGWGLLVCLLLRCDLLSLSLSLSLSLYVGLFFSALLLLPPPPCRFIFERRIENLFWRAGKTREFGSTNCKGHGNCGVRLFDKKLASREIAVYLSGRENVDLNETLLLLRIWIKWKVNTRNWHSNSIRRVYTYSYHVPSIVNFFNI